MFFYRQMAGGEDAWLEALADSRDSVIATKKPRYVTVLDLSEIIRDEMTREQILGVRYRGPLYFDWDAPEIEVSINKVNQFREKLAELGLNPATVRWYATGGRGFHAEIAPEIFIPKPSPKGYVHLPSIYKEMAFDLYTDAMDMRVYSAKRGRMWRTPNVQRENGRYKVPLSAADLEAMTPALYEELTAAPREAPPLPKTEFNPELGLMYEKARLKVEAAAKKRVTGVKDLELLKRFKGDWPPTIARLMANEGVKGGVGFHSIAMQIAITANAIGKSEEDMLKAADHLIQNHISDGSRYNSPKKRRAELERLYHYTKDNVCYGYSKGAVKVLVAEGVDTGDLDGMPDEAGERLDQAPANDTDTANGKDGDKGLDLRGGIEMRETGLYKKDIENGVQLISDIAFKDVRVLLSFPSVDRPSELWGFEAEVLLQGKSKGRQQIDMTTFLSKQRYQEFAMRNMGVMKGNDNDVAGLSTILRDMGVRAGEVAYVTRREGLDYVVRPDSDPPVRDLIWVETGGVYGAGGTPLPYIFRPQVPSGSVFQSDVWKAPLLTGDGNERAFFEALFQMNDPGVLAPLIGWMTSCYHRMLYDAFFNKQFPLCEVWGQAGSGKTQTTLLMANLHFYSNDPLNLQCSGLTPYYLQTHASASCSIPLILDEYKPRQMPARMKEALPTALRAAYNNGAFGKGGEGEQLGQGWKSLSKLSYSAPILFISEALETETAIMERTVSVPVSKSGIVGRQRHLRHVVANRKVLSSAGRSILEYTLTKTNLEEFRKLVERNIDTASTMFKPDTLHRVVYNLGVVLTGFDFFSHTLRQVFGGTLDAELARLRESILVEPAQTAGTIMAEASKVLDTLAYISNNEDTFSPNGMKIEKDYVFANQAGLPCIDIKMQAAYVKYAGWCRTKGQQPLYDNFDAFCHGMAHYAPIINKTCLDSPLKESGLVRVYRFSLQKLKDEGVQAFKGEMNA